MQLGFGAHPHGLLLVAPSVQSLQHSYQIKPMVCERGRDSKQHIWLRHELTEAIGLQFQQDQQFARRLNHPQSPEIPRRSSERYRK
jgi:hypothetical protein